MDEGKKTLFAPLPLDVQEALSKARLACLLWNEGADCDTAIQELDALLDGLEVPRHD